MKGHNHYGVPAVGWKPMNKIHSPHPSRLSAMTFRTRQGAATAHLGQALVEYRWPVSPFGEPIRTGDFERRVVFAVVVSEIVDLGACYRLTVHSPLCRRSESITVPYSDVEHVRTTNQ